MKDDFEVAGVFISRQNKEKHFWTKLGFFRQILCIHCLFFSDRYTARVFLWTISCNSFSDFFCQSKNMERSALLDLDLQRP